MRDVRVGLALGGGVARGIAHVGVLQVLEENNVPVHMVAGTSAGSLVGAMYAAGLDPWALEKAAARMNWRGLVRLRLRREGLLDSEGLERFLLQHVGDVGFDELRLPFAAVCSDLCSGEEVVLDTGRVATAVRASCAFPGIFVPVKVGGRVLVDGGLVNNVPTSVARRMGADVVVAVDLHRPRRGAAPPRNLLHIILYSVAVMQRPQIAQCLADADVVVRPDLAGFGVVELERASELVRAGREATEQVLPALTALLEERRQSAGRPV